MDAQKDSERIDPEHVVRLTIECANIDIDKSGWYALLIDKERGIDRVGRGRTAWEAVRATRMPANASLSGGRRPSA